MARVQCFDCDMPVVVDPHGRCPEGHDLGPVGERIEQSLGRAEPHPDEPQPWVAVLGTDEVAPEPTAASTPRPARPISVGPEPSDEERSGSTDGLLQELHDLHGTGDAPAGDRVGGPSTAQPSRSGDSSPAAAPPSPETADPWDDWDDWTNAAAEATVDDPADPSDVTEDATPHDATPHDATPEDNAASADAGPEPAPAPRRAPTVRSEESLSAMAELAALLGDDSSTPTSPPSSTPSPEPAADPAPSSGPGPAPARTPTSEPSTPQADPSTSPPPAPPTSPGPLPAGSPADAGDRLATVSQLPVRPRPPEDGRTPMPLPGPPSAPVEEAPSREGKRAVGDDTIDVGNFTAKGKKRRFGR